MKSSKVYTGTEPKISIPWHWNSVNETSVLLPKCVLNNFTTMMFSLRDTIKFASD